LGGGGEKKRKRAHEKTGNFRVEMKFDRAEGVAAGGETSKTNFPERSRRILGQAQMWVLTRKLKSERQDDGQVILSKRKKEDSGIPQSLRRPHQRILVPGSKKQSKGKKTAGRENTLEGSQK